MTDDRLHYNGGLTPEKLEMHGIHSACQLLRTDAPSSLPSPSPPPFHTDTPESEAHV